jgi:CRP/FNR family cyclic AMP-dependent transcriptional regulator
VAGRSGWRPRTARESFLDLLPPKDRASLEARARTHEFNKDDLLFEQGSPPGRLVIIQAGLVKVSSRSASGIESVLAIRGAGDILGEMSSVDDRPRSATVTALNPVKALVLDPPVFDELLLHPSTARALLTVLVRRLREADRQRLQYGSQGTVTQRVATLLTGLIEYGKWRDGRVLLEMELSQQDLASAVGASRGRVNRSLAELSDQGILTTQRQRIVILRPRELRRMGD